MLLAALGARGKRPGNRRLLESLPGYPARSEQGSRVLRRDIRDLQQAGLLAGEGKALAESELRALSLLGPLAQRSRAFPFREALLRAWTRAGRPGLASGLGPVPSVVALGREHPAKVEFLHQAVLERRLLSFVYRRPGRDGGSRKRRLEPWGLGLHDGAWRLLGRDPESGEPATYLLSGIRKERLETGNFRAASAFDLRAALRRPSWSRNGIRNEVRLLARGQASRALRELAPAWLTLGPVRRGRAEGRLKGVLPKELARWALPFGGHIRVRASGKFMAELRREVLDLIGGKPASF